jgi:hypothetical protein
MWLRGNALEDYVLCLAELLDGNSSCGNVDVGLCVVSVTLWRGEHGEREMSYLSHVVDPRSIPRVAGRDPSRILFCDATGVVVMFFSLVAHGVRSFFQ